ncbi:MAG: helix-turn-helix transcriptional regulator [Cytophagales bacterium]|nr:helix-turn-helix transcriptional regulator [Armatimonadota bacterium]
MGYSLNRIEGLATPFQEVHEQIVEVAPGISHPFQNQVRKLLFVLGGECRHQILGWDGPWNEVHLRPGDILVLPCRCKQRYFGVEPGSEARVQVVRLSFDPERLPPLPLGARGKATLPDADGDASAWADYCLREIRHLRAGRDAALSETLGHLRDEAERRAPGFRPRVHGLCVGLTILCARLGAAEPHTGDSPTSDRRVPAGYHVGKIKSYLRSRLHQPTHLSEVAAFVGLSEEYVARLFKSTTGLTVFEYARRLRITEAKNLLATTDDNLSEIARQTGFSSLTVFSRNFRRDAGMTPSEFRREIARQIG